MRSGDTVGTANGLVEFEMCGFGPKRNGILLLLNQGLIISELPLKRSACRVESGLKGGYVNCSEREVFTAEFISYEKCWA